ncbi:MAG: TldD/PmbA family protein [Candidatus Binatia bacterium]
MPSVDLDIVAARFRAVAPAVAHCALRVVDERDEHLSVRRGIVQPPHVDYDTGAMVTVWDRGGVGYAATSDLTASGLRAACRRATAWARATAASHVLRTLPPAPVPRGGEYHSRVAKPWSGSNVADKLDLLRVEAERLRPDPRIVDWDAGLWHTAMDTLVVTTDGGRVRQHFEYLLPSLSATANTAAETHTRSFGGHAFCRQGGLEVLDDTGFFDAAPRIAAQAIELLSAPHCPSDTMDLVIAPDQMILQIHESIGHPLELDRILGDERNYAGRSFVTLDMFGHYQYGSPLLNVTFDPSRAGELASYGFDDDGQPASRAAVIERGILLRPLGSATSSARAGLDGVANARAASWNRPPIDRMANLNLEPGDQTFAALVRAVEQGVYVETNCSWSIDDSRNKFQFGCEWGRRIVDGELGEVVKTPNYRGISATFWRSLAGVGGPETVQVLGTPWCGKGEPNQVIRVGHAAPACLFRAVEVVGGATG